MAQRDERLYFAEMLSAIDRALEYTAGGREVFFTEPKTQDAVVRHRDHRRGGQGCVGSDSAGAS